MFNVIEKEMQWRENQGLSKGFDTMRKCKPIVAVGAEEPLNGQTMLADYYRSFLPRWKFSKMTTNNQQMVSMAWAMPITR